ncbi:PTS galactitol transporter subunit IIA, partial [Escherichia coli]|nr:PTS galactitol transporter subunit IIA [Escherichia coli]
LMMSLWDALRMNMMISYQELVRTFPKSSAIYLLRPTNKVHFQQADDDNDVAVSLVIALIVENPQQQLKLLRCLFGKLQQPDIVETLITLPETQLKEYFTKYVLDSDE